MEEAEVVNASLLDQLMFALMAEGIEVLSGVRDRFTIILQDYQVAKKSTALTVYTEGKNEFYIKKFLLSKAVAGCTKSTIEFYGRELRKIFNAIGKDADTVTGDDIQYFLALRMRDGVSKSFCDTQRRCLNTFYTHMMREEFISKNPMVKIDKIRFHKQEETAFSELDVEKIRAGCQTNRERCIVEVLLSTGCRISELLSIRTADIGNGVINILGKGEKYRNVYLNAKAQLAIEAYLAERNDTNPYLFPGAVVFPGTTQKERLQKCRQEGRDWYKDPKNVSADQSLDKRSVKGMLDRLGKRANVEKCHPHRFRRTCATFALRRGMPIEQVCKMLGHASISTTQIYLDLREEELVQAHKKYVY